LRQRHLEAVQHLAFLPMQSPTPYGSARMICLVSASMAQVMQIGSHLKGFDLSTGDGKISAQFPGKMNLCNDMTVASDGTVGSRPTTIWRSSADTRSLQAYLGHKNIQHTVRHTELSPTRFKDFWKD
jgi:hypothetical protein